MSASDRDSEERAAGGVDRTVSGAPVAKRLAGELRHPIRLTRTFLTVTVILVAFVLAVQSWFHATWLRQDLLENSTANAVRIARNLHHQILRDFRRSEKAPSPDAEPDTATSGATRPGRIEEFDPGAVELDAGPRPGAFGTLSTTELARLDRLVTQALGELEVVAVYIFDTERRITYSSRLEHVGFEIGPNPHYDEAVRGKVSAVLVGRGNPLDVSGAPVGISLLETYVPIHVDGRVVGVVEIYQDASELESLTRDGVVDIGIVSLGGFLMLALTLALLVRRADRALAERTAALIGTNEALIELSETLEELVEERGRQLSRAETLASLGTLAAGLAHEINNPVATIAGSSESLLRRVRDGRANEQRLSDYLELIRDEAYRVKDITRNLLDFARAGTGERRPIDLREPLTAMAEILALRAEEDGITLETVLGDCPARILGEDTALRQLLLNVTVNALDATPRGGFVRWTLEPTGDEVRLVCEDSGPGIPEDLRERVTEPFFTTKDPGKGTGLGLAISARIVEDHGGHLELGISDAGGTRVTLHFPALEETSA